jgi:hypothetical protein
MDFYFILNKNSTWTHMQLECDMVGVVGKLAKYVKHFLKEKN